LLKRLQVFPEVLLRLAVYILRVNSALKKLWIFSKPSRLHLLSHHCATHRLWLHDGLALARRYLDRLQTRRIKHVTDVYHLARARGVPFHKGSLRKRMHISLDIEWVVRYLVVGVRRRLGPLVRSHVQRALHLVLFLAWLLGVG
jgi:hypothetical protein